MSELVYAYSPDYDVWCVYRKTSILLMAFVCRCKSLDEAMEKCKAPTPRGIDKDGI